MTTAQIVHAQNEMMRLKGTSAHAEQKKIVDEQKKKLPRLMVAIESFDLDWGFTG
jgi:hypothetical protein